MTTVASWPRMFIALGALNGALAVGAGAYGWHALDADSAGQDIFMMGSQYQMWHGIGLIAVGLTGRILSGNRAGFWAQASGLLFLAGTVMFCGTLYIFGLTGTLALPHIAPIGGMSLMAGWLALGVAALVSERT